MTNGVAFMTDNVHVRVIRAGFALYSALADGAMWGAYVRSRHLGYDHHTAVAIAVAHWEVHEASYIERFLP